MRVVRGSPRWSGAGSVAEVDPRRDSVDCRLLRGVVGAAPHLASRDSEDQLAVRNLFFRNVCSVHTDVLRPVHEGTASYGRDRHGLHRGVKWL